jgi:hypothetical protein
MTSSHTPAPGSRAALGSPTRASSMGRRRVSSAELSTTPALRRERRPQARTGSGPKISLLIDLGGFDFVRSTQFPSYRHVGLSNSAVTASEGTVEARASQTPEVP